MLPLAEMQLKALSFDFVGIETTTDQINALLMTHFHLDLWSSDFTV
jgi:hypothetical protein